MSTNASDAALYKIQYNITQPTINLNLSVIILFNVINACTDSLL